MPHQRGRRNLRLPGWDYSAGGAYFITVCAHEREDRFGTIVDGEMRLNDVGEVVADAWRWLTSRYPYVSLDEWCVMPDHLHGILILADVATGGSPIATAVDGSDPQPRRKSIGGLVGAFKTVSTKQVNRLRETPGRMLWQRNFYERVVRNDTEMNSIRRYIRQNPSA